PTSRRARWIHTCHQRLKVCPEGTSPLNLLFARLCDFLRYPAPCWERRTALPEPGACVGPRLWVDDALLVRSSSAMLISPGFVRVADRSPKGRNGGTSTTRAFLVKLTGTGITGVISLSGCLQDNLRIAGDPTGVGSDRHAQPGSRVAHAHRLGRGFL